MQASGEQTERLAVGSSSFYGLLRVRPVILDTGPLTTDVIRSARKGEPSPLALAMLVGVLRGYAAHHVWAEVPRVLAKRAPRAGVTLAALEKLWWDSYVPLIHFVDTHGLPTTEQSRALAERDASDAPTLVLAGLLAPAVIIAEDRDILASGLAYEQWNEFYDVVRTLNTGRTNVHGASLLISLGARGALATMRGLANLGASPMGGTLAAIALLGLGAAAYRRSPDVREIWSRGKQTCVELGQRLTTTFLAFSKRLEEAESTWSEAERGARRPDLVSRIAGMLATAESPLTRTEIVAALHLPRQRGLLDVTRGLHSYPAFVQPTPHRWQLGRDGMDFGGS